MGNTEKNGKKKKFWLVLLIFFLIIFIVAGSVLFKNLVPPKNPAPQKYKNSSVASKPDVKLVDNPIDFKSLKKDNGDVIAWIKVDGTVVDYPVLMSGEDKVEDFYIDHDMDLNPKKAGSIFVQLYNQSNFSDFNTVVYGHNMLNGTMFGTLKRFRDSEFFKKNRNIYVYTVGHILKYEIISAFVHDDRHLLNEFNASVEEDRQKFVDLCKNPVSLSKNVVENFNATKDDLFITLSTCTSLSAEHERYLVVGKLVSDTLTY